MPTPLKLIAPTSLQRYDCTGCGDCCRGRFAIIISRADRDRIEKQAWTSDELGLGRQPLFRRRGDDFQLAHRPDGACVFLGADNLCRIHARFGEPAKPLACRMYPFRPIPAGREVRVDIRFDCPAVASNHGRQIGVYKSQIAVLLKEIARRDSAGEAPPPFRPGASLTWPQLARATEAFNRILLDVSIDITRRIVACVNLAALLRHAAPSDVTESTWGDMLDELTAAVQSEALVDPLNRRAPMSSDAVMFRHILGVHGRTDTFGRKVSRLGPSLAMLRGTGPVPALRDGFPAVNFAQMETATGIPGGDRALAIERFLHVHLMSMGFFGRGNYGRTFLDGLGSLLLTYPTVCWFARVYAAGDGLESPSLANVETALSVVDHQRGSSPLLGNASARFLIDRLTERHTLHGLTVWYGS